MLKKFCQIGIVPVLLLITTPTHAAPVVRHAAGADPASIQATVDGFRADLGGANNNAGNSFPDGRREINWDGVPDNFAAPNNLPPDFFNVNSPRGAVFQTPGEGFQVSANQGVAPIEFDNINPTYSSLFRTFSPQRLFTALDSNVTEIIFFVPGTQTRATVSGFGAVFTDVDRKRSTRIDYFDVNDRLLYSAYVPNVPRSNESLSFLGVSFNEGERVYRVQITSGNASLNAHTNKQRRVDLVVMDDFIYGEPQSIATPPAEEEMMEEE
jgi:hypothetical protein